MSAVGDDAIARVMQDAQDLYLQLTSTTAALAAAAADEDAVSIGSDTQLGTELISGCAPITDLTCDSEEDSPIHRTVIVISDDEDYYDSHGPAPPPASLLAHAFSVNGDGNVSPSDSAAPPTPLTCMDPPHQPAPATPPVLHPCPSRHTKHADRTALFATGMQRDRILIAHGTISRTLSCFSGTFEYDEHIRVMSIINPNYATAIQTVTETLERAHTISRTGIPAHLADAPAFFYNTDTVAAAYQAMPAYDSPSSPTYEPTTPLPAAATSACITPAAALPAAAECDESEVESTDTESMHDQHEAEDYCRCQDDAIDACIKHGDVPLLEFPTMYYSPKCMRSTHRHLARTATHPPVLTLAHLRTICTCPPPSPPDHCNGRANGGKGLGKSRAPKLHHSDADMLDPEHHLPEQHDEQHDDAPACPAHEVLLAAEEARDAYCALGNTYVPETVLEIQS